MLNHFNFQCYQWLVISYTGTPWLCNFIRHIVVEKIHILITVVSFALNIINASWKKMLFVNDMPIKRYVIDMRLVYDISNGERTKDSFEQH